MSSNGGGVGPLISLLRLSDQQQTVSSPGTAFVNFRRCTWIMSLERNRHSSSSQATGKEDASKSIGLDRRKDRSTGRAIGLVRPCSAFETVQVLLSAHHRCRAEGSPGGRPPAKASFTS